jgi:PHP family Zn ribbon phosphoesterase
MRSRDGLRTSRDGLRTYAADLHVHTGLSPCAEADMNPENIIGLCLEYGIDIVAITDHNSGANARAVRELAEGTPVTVWPGMEVETREEVHLVALAEDLEGLGSWQEFIYAHMPHRPNRPGVFGEQWLFDKDSRVVGTVDRLLLTSATLSVNEVRLEAQRRGLVIYPAHIDRPAYGYISNLGLPPPAEDFGLFELSARTTLEEVRGKYPSLEGRIAIVSSDAHRLEELGPARTRLHLYEPTLAEFRAAIAGRDGRKVEIY